MISASLLGRIDQKNQIIQSNRPLSKQLLGKLQEPCSLDLTYNSNDPS